VADYQGGKVWLQVVPSFRGVQTLISGQAAKWGRDAGREFDRAFDREIGRSRTQLGPSSTESKKQGADAAGSFADGFRRRVAAAMNALPPAKLKADATEAERTLRDLRLHLEELSAKTIGVDMDTAEAVAQIQAIDQQLAALNDESADVQVIVDTAAARVQLSAIQAQVNDLDRDDVNIRVDVDGRAGLSTLDTFTGRLLLLGAAGAALAPAIVPAAGLAVGALAGIGPAAIAGVAGLGVLALAFGGIGDALDATRDAQAELERTGEVSEATAAKVSESMAAISPAGQGFVGFLAGLAPVLQQIRDVAQTALFPGLQRGIEALLPVLPAITEGIGAFAGVMGDIFAAAGEALAGPEWQAFFAEVVGLAPLLSPLAESLGNLALGFGNLLLAFAPLAKVMIDGLLDLSEAFVRWTRSRGFQAFIDKFIDYVTENGPMLLDVFDSLLDAVANLVRSMLPFAPVVLRIVKGFADFIAVLPPGVLAAIVLGVLAIISAFNLIAPVMSVVIAAVTGGLGAVIGIAAAVVVGLALLAAALIAAYLHSETFRDIVNAAFRAVGAAATFLWEKAIRPAFSAIAGFITGTLAPTVKDLWTNVAKPAFEGIAEAVRVAWESVIQPAFRALDGFVRGVLAPTMLWLWREVVQPAWTGIQIAIDVAWALIRVVLGAFEAYVRGVLAPVFGWLWHTIIEPAFNGISSVITTVWNEGIKPVLEALGNFIEEAVAPAFQRGVDAIGRIWETIRDLAKAPVRFVIETVINEGIIGTFNWIADKVPGVDKIDPVKLPKGFATGGIYPGYTPGRDIGFIGVSGGEAIMRPEWTRALGAERVHAMNAVARTEGVAGVRRRYLGGFDDGGVVGGILGAAKGGVDWVKEGIGSVVGAVGDFVIGNLKKAAAAAFGPILDRLSDVGDGMFGQLAGGFARKSVDGILGFFGLKDDEGGDLGGGGFARSSSGWPPAVRGRLSPNTAAAMRFVRDMFGVSSGGLGQRSNKSDHPMGKALDAMIPNWGKATGIALGNQIASWFVSNASAFGTKYVIWRDQINSGSGWRPYTHPSGNTTNPTLRHMDHVHVSLFDQGGRLPTGLSTVMNATGRPELVLNGRQESAIEAVLRGRLTAADFAMAATGGELPDMSYWKDAGRVHGKESARAYARELTAQTAVV
jgi:phage-related protein